MYNDEGPCFPQLIHDCMYYAYSQVYVKNLIHTLLHIGMILSTFGLSSHSFDFGLFPKNLIPMKILSILMNS